jgi:hypothetical protein
MTNLSALFGSSAGVNVGDVMLSFGAPSVAGQTYVLCNGGSVLRATYPALSAVYPVGSQPRPLMNWSQLTPPTGYQIQHLAFDGTTYVAVCRQVANTAIGAIYTSTDLSTWTSRFSITLASGNFKGGVTYLGGTPAWAAYWYSNTAAQNFMATASTATGTWTGTVGGLSTVTTSMYDGYGGARAFQLGAKTILPLCDTSTSSATVYKLVVTTNSGSTWTTVDLANATAHGSANIFPQIIYNATTGYIYVFARPPQYAGQGQYTVFQCLASADWSVAANWSMLYNCSNGSQLTAGYQYSFAWNDAITTPGGALLVADYQGIRRSTSASTNAPVFSGNLIPQYYDYASFNYASGYAPLWLFTVGTKIYTIGYQLPGLPGASYSGATSRFSRNNMVLLCSLDDGLTWNPVGGGYGVPMPQTNELLDNGFYAYSAGWVYNSSTGALINPTAQYGMGGAMQGSINLPEYTDATAVYIPPQTWFPPTLSGKSYYMRVA